MECDTIAQSCIMNKDAGPQEAMTRNATFTTCGTRNRIALFIARHSVLPIQWIGPLLYH